MKKNTIKVYDILVDDDSLGYYTFKEDLYNYMRKFIFAKGFNQNDKSTDEYNNLFSDSYLDEICNMLYDNGISFVCISTPNERYYNLEVMYLMLESYYVKDIKELLAHVDDKNFSISQYPRKELKPLVERDIIVLDTLELQLD